MRRNQSFVNKKTLLYLIATPIGNLGDFSPRALEILNDVAVVACEDSRNTGSLLSHFRIRKQLLSLHEHNELEGAERVLSLLQNGQNVAYVSDAGYPAISDPGERLVAYILDHGMQVSVIPGPSAFLQTLVASGLATNHFYFHGFLDAKTGARNRSLVALAKKQETLVFYEAPHRILKTLAAMAEIFGDRKAVIGRELTKMYEEYIYFTLNEWSTLDEASLRGEMVIVIEGSQELPVNQLSDEQIGTQVEAQIKNGLSARDAIKAVAVELNLSKNVVSDIYYRIKAQ